MKRRQSTFVAALAVFGLVAAACSEDTTSDGGATTESSAGSEGTEPTDGSSDGDSADVEAVKDANLEDSSVEHGLAYTGGPGGETSGEPIVIGYVNQEGGTVSFPEASIGAEAAVWFANTYLGGVGGRPIELA
jgi:branched-chain amino acid transport system substrate-binding protein